MKNVLEAINNRDRAPAVALPDKVLNALNDSIGNAAEELNRTKFEVKNLQNELGTVSSERDRLQTTLGDMSKGSDELAIEVGQLREHSSTVEATLKQSRAAVKLEQSTLQAVVDEAKEERELSVKTIMSLREELAGSIARTEGLEKQIRDMKKMSPTNITQPTPINSSLEGLEFEVGNVIRGPDGIQGAKIKLTRANS